MTRSTGKPPAHVPFSTAMASMARAVARKDAMVSASMRAGFHATTRATGCGSIRASPIMSEPSESTMRRAGSDSVTLRPA
jgi:hypothetical protein